MVLNIAVLLCALALLGALIMILATGVRTVQRVSGWILAPAGLCGLVLYTLAYLEGGQGLAHALSALFHGVYTTCLMFMGRNDYSNLVRLAPWFAQNPWLQVLFWVAHLAALFVSASALLSTLGKKLIQTLRLRISRAKTVYLIFGLHQQSIYLGRDLAAQNSGLIVYIDPKSPPDLQEQVMAFGGVVRQGPYLPGGEINTRLMRLLGIRNGGRRVVALALDKSEVANIHIVDALTDYFAAENISPDLVDISLRSHGELDFSQLAQFEDKAVLYDVDAFSDAELSARLLIHEAPPYKTMQFDRDGRAMGDFSALIIGFGDVGQHTLRQVVMNSQFCGSRFSAVVVDKDAQQISGQFMRRYVGLMAEYDIQFCSMDTRCREFYDLLDQLAPTLNYIVVCLGDDNANYEATAALERYYARLDDGHLPSILVSVCNKRYVAKTRQIIRFFDRQLQVYSSQILLRDQVDLMAKAVNFSYSEATTTPQGVQEAWRNAKYFSRESSRTSADFIPAMLAIAGMDEARAADPEAFAQAVPPGSPLLESLAVTEHLRWNAFHYAFGYTPMSLEEVKHRAAAGADEVQKDTYHLRHSCLVDWDDLDRVSQVVGPLIGKPALDYKELDRNNVRNIPRTLGIHRILREI